MIRAAQMAVGAAGIAANLGLASTGLPEAAQIPAALLISIVTVAALEWLQGCRQ